VIDVVSYEHAPIATGETLADGANRFLDTTVMPEIKTVQGADFQAVDALHKKNNTAVLLSDQSIPHHSMKQNIQLYDLFYLPF
jgi:hypothetical protein